MPFSPDSPPKRAGDYTRFLIKRATSLPPSTGSIVAIPFTSEWGPMDVPTLVDSFAEFIDTFGAPLDPINPPEGYIAVYNAFKGEGENQAGAGAVLCIRHAGSAAAKATLGLVAGATSPAITVTAKYEGTRGNQYKIGVAANVADATNKRDVSIYYGDTLLQTFPSIGASDIVTLGESINRIFPDLVASGATNGTKLDVITATSLASGNNGTTLVAGDWTATRAALEPHPFGYFAPANLTDSGILASTVTWAVGLNNAEKSKRFFLAIGGAAGENFNTAATRSAGINSEHVINFGVGTYHDSQLDKDLSTAQLAPRLAGVASARGGRSSLTFAYLDDLTILVGPSDLEIVAALDQGVIVVGLGQAGVRFERGVTTYTDKISTSKPFEVYSKLKYVTTMMNFERDGREANEAGNILGLLNVNPDTREFIVAREQQRLNEYIERGEVQAGAEVFISSNPPPSDDDEFIAIDWVGKFARTLEQIHRTVIFS